MGEWDGPEESRHELTREDLVKGGEAITERKRRALALNATKHGRYAKTLANEFTFCDGCVYKTQCIGYQEHAACKLRLEVLKCINRVAGGDAQAWLNVTLHLMQELFVLTKAEAPKQKRESLERFQKLWLDLGKILFPQQIRVSGTAKEIKVVFDDGDSQDSVQAP